MRSLFVLAFSIGVSTGFAQTVPVAKPDTAKSSTAATPLSYEKVFNKPALTRAGLFTIKSMDNKWYFEIPDSLLKRYILVVTRYKATPAGFGSYGGEEVNQQTVYFEKSGETKLFLRAVAFVQDGADSAQSLYKAIQTSSVNPIVAAFDIKTVNKSTKSYVIDVTEFFRKDNPVITINQMEKADKKLGSLMDDRSWLTDIRSYPINLEISTVKTFSTTSQAYASAYMTGTTTLEMNTSMVLLPATPMRRRFFDERVGFFANKYILFDEQDQAAKKMYQIQRYRLEPKPEDMEKYKRGELVETAKPIVYYIDPATPKKWRSYLIAGVNDWQKAFEQAGFKNAIMAKEWPEGDTTMSLEDARFSVIRYYASEIPNAYGPRISDPRSGEIIESHVGWYHNVMKLVHDWYMTQIGPLDPRAQHMKFDDELMGDLIRFVSSHEIGHTIGLRHNMGASSMTPVEKLRDKKWVEANGHTVSIMDYARFNYVAQPEDNIGKAGIYPRIGMYDKWAIQWGYKLYPGQTDANSERVLLNKLIIDSLSANPRLWFAGEGKDENPRSQREDLSDNVIQANEYGMKNLQRVVAHLPEWTKEEGDLYNNLAEMHANAVKQYKRYIMHVSKHFGNRYFTIKSIEEKGPVYENPSKETIKSALKFINAHVLNAPLWLYPEYTKTILGIRPANDIIEQQNYMMQILLNAGLLYNIQQINLDDAKYYKVNEYLDDLLALVWSRIPANETEAFYKRSAQRIYLERLAQVLYNKEESEGKPSPMLMKSDVRLFAKTHLQKLKSHIALQLTQPTSALNRQHYQQVKLDIDRLISKTTSIK
ncbi:MAG TPA: zinc-dependent metalloprotease [Niastella sp.]